MRVFFPAALIGAALLLPTVAAPPPCTLSLTPDSVRGALYHVNLHVSSSCAADTAFRVRKSSTTSTKRNGAPYQPIKPLVGAWTVRKLSSTIPRAELWSLVTWRWERYNPNVWNPRTGGYGQWQRIPVAGEP